LAKHTLKKGMAKVLEKHTFETGTAKAGCHFLNKLFLKSFLLKTTA